MSRYVRPAPPPSADGAAHVDVRELTTAETEGMSLIFAAAMGVSDLATVPLLGLPALEGWHCYAAYLEEREVACGAMLIDGDLAVLGLDATTPAARHRGCHSELIRAASPMPLEPAASWSSPSRTTTPTTRPRGDGTSSAPGSSQTGQRPLAAAAADRRLSLRRHRRVR